ncbi:MAG: hypothetical protein RL095_3152 [Verrucomicrobiota bacterium]|jgi:hypothetical protein
MSDRKKLWRWILGFLGVGLFAAIFILGLPWRWAFEHRVAKYQARGEPVCAADLKPKTVPAEDNGGPLIEVIVRDIKEYPAWKNTYLGAVLRPEELRHLILLEKAAMDLEKIEKAKFAAFSPEELEAQRKRSRTLKAAKIAGLSQTEKNKLDDEEKIRKQYRDLTLLLSEQPDLLDRLEKALAKPHCQFSTEYKSPSWRILLPHLSFCRQIGNLLVDLSRYYEALGEPIPALRCRLMLLRTPQMLKDEPFLFSGLVHASLTGIVCSHLGEQFPRLRDDELLELLAAAESLEAWPISRAQMMMVTRVNAVEAIQLPGTTIAEASEGIVGGQIYFRSCLRYFDGLYCLQDFDLAIAGNPIPPKNKLSFMGGILLPGLDTVHTKFQIEAAKIRQFRLGLALELHKRRTGTYPADLSGISLPSHDHEGKPMKYEVFNEGRGACLEFENKLSCKTAHFGLGERLEKHPCGEQAK